MVLQIATHGSDSQEIFNACRGRLHHPCGCSFCSWVAWDGVEVLLRDLLEQVLGDTCLFFLVAVLLVLRGVAIGWSHDVSRGGHVVGKTVLRNLGPVSCYSLW